jgi:hypothetical protein
LACFGKEAHVESPIQFVANFPGVRSLREGGDAQSRRREDRQSAEDGDDDDDDASSDGDGCDADDSTEGRNGPGQRGPQSRRRTSEYLTVRISGPSSFARPFCWHGEGDR